MYIPTKFEERDEAELLALISAYPLAALVIQTQAQSNFPLSADHLPMMIHTRDDGALGLIGHAARANPLCERIDGGVNCLAIFQGPSHYMSPAWYASKPTDPRVVPTWNYQVVHVEGVLHAIHDKAAKLRIVTQLTDRFEHDREQRGDGEPWSIDDAPKEYIDRMLEAIVGLELRISRIAGKSKVSQNQPLDNQLSAAEALASIPTDRAASMARAIKLKNEHRHLP